MASTDDVKITVVVDGSGAVKTLDTLGNELQSVRQTGEKTAQGFSSFQASLISFNAALDIGTKAWQVFSSAMGAAVDILERGSAVDDVASAFANLSNKAGAVSDVLLNQLRKATGDTIDNFQLMAEANKALLSGLKPDQFVTVAAAARQLSETYGGTLTDNMDILRSAIERGNDMLLKSRGILIDNKKAFEDYAKAAGKPVGELNELGKAEAMRAAILQRLNPLAEEGAKIQADAADNIAVMSTAWKNASDEFVKAIATNTDLNKVLTQFAKIIKNLDFQPAISGVSKLVSSIITLSELLVKSSPLLQGYGNAYELYGLQNQIDSGTTKKQLAQVTDFLNIANKIADSALPKERDALKDVHAELDKYFTKTDDADKKAKDFLQTIEKTAAGIGTALGQGDWKGAFGEIFSGLGTGGDLTKGLADAIGKALPAGIKDIFGAGNAAIVGTAVGSAGSALILSFATKEVEKAIDLASRGKWRDLLGSGIKKGLALPTAGLSLLIPNSVFGIGDSAGTEAKKAADAYFADLFDANRLSVVIDGQMQQVKDLVFSGNQDNSIFAGMSAGATAAFEGVGTAFEGLIGNMDGLAVNLAAVFANNVGGSLNNLQLLIQATGVSAEQLQESIVAAFENGKISALDAQTALQGIAQVTQEGIPDGVGLVDQAFKNLQASTVNGGRAMVDAIKDIGSEARELGIKDFPGIAEELKRRMPEAAAQIDEVFNALAANGISTIDQLTTATTEQLIPALSQLQAQDFPFAKATEDLTALIDRYNQIPEEIRTKVVIDVETRGDTAALNYVTGGGVDNRAGQGYPAK